MPPTTSTSQSSRSQNGQRLVRETAKARINRLSPWYTFAAIAVVLLLLQLANFVQPAHLAPDVPEIFVGVWQVLTQDFGAVISTVQRFVLALLVSMFAGWLIGLCMAAYPLLGRILEPYFAIVMATPALSWILIAVLWLRTVELRVFFIVIIIALPFYVVNTYEGVRSIDRDVVQGVEQFRPTRAQRIRTLLVPYSTQYIILTTKSVAGFVMRILVFAELIGASSGIGYEMNFAQANFRIDLVLAWTFVLIIINFGVMALVRLVERSALGWRPQALDQK